jgi:hypothetical protein
MSGDTSRRLSISGLPATTQAANVGKVARLNGGSVPLITQSVKPIAIAGRIQVVMQVVIDQARASVRTPPTFAAIRRASSSVGK